MAGSVCFTKCVELAIDRQENVTATVRYTIVDDTVGDL